MVCTSINMIITEWRDQIFHQDWYWGFFCETTTKTFWDPKWYWYSQNHRKSLDTKKSQDEMPDFDNLEDHVNLVQVHLSGEGLRAGRERERRYGGGGHLSIRGEGRGAIREGGRSSIWEVGRFSFCGWRYVSWGGVALSCGGSVEIILFCSAECIADISLASWWPSYFIAYTV